jgi:hypothetical protein
MIEYRNLRWHTKDHSQLYTELKHPDYGWIPYCCMDGDTGIGSEIWKNRNNLKIAEYVEIRNLEQVRAFKLSEIKSEKTKVLTKGSVSFKNDTFSIDDTSLLRISSTIQDWKDQIDNGLDESKINQKWVSQTNEVHDLTYSELVDLARNMRLKVQSVVLYANALKDQVAQCNTIEEIDNIKWTFD